MGVVLGKATYPHQAVQGAGKLMAVHQAQFSQAFRQIPVGIDLPLIGEDGAGAVHGLDGIVHVVDLGEVHVVLVVIPVAGADPQIPVEDHGGTDLLIAPSLVLLPPEGFQLVAQDHAVGVEEGEPRTFVMDIEQIQLPAQLPVIPLFGFLDAEQVFVQ